jgi:hypothetical protein
VGTVVATLYVEKFDITNFEDPSVRARRSLFTVIVGVVLSVAACSGIATAPSEPTATAPSFGLINDLLNATLLKCSSLPAASGTADIGPAGGVVRVGPHTLVIPPGALSRQTTIRGDVVPGSVNSVRFAPEGLRFARNAALTMSYSNCSGLGMLLPKRIVYTDEGLRLLEILRSIDLSGQKLVTAPLEHFSRYAVAY